METFLIVVVVALVTGFFTWKIGDARGYARCERETAQRWWEEEMGNSEPEEGSSHDAA